MSADLVNEFTRTVFNHLFAAQNSTGNIAFSGLSLYSLMAVINLGLGGRSREQLSSFLNRRFTQLFDESLFNPPEDMQACYNDRELIKSVSELSYYVFHCCGIFDPYRSTSKQFFDLNIQVLSLRHQNMIAPTRNEWINNKIYGLMNNLLKDSLDSDSQLVFINTLFFNNNWFIPFNIEDTKQEIFRDDKDRPLMVSMMNHEDYYQIYVDYPHDVTVLFIPLKQVYVYGVVVLPREGYALKDMIKNFRWDEVHDYYRKSEWRTIHLKMPKFKICSENNLINALALFDITDIFNEDVADLRVMIKSKGYIEKLAQLAIVSIDENGEKPEAPTKNRVTYDASLSYENFAIDRPFLFLIYAHSTKQILFSMAVTNPNKE
ncbi:Alpha-1-antitrypsin [Thelohanellus kitauei]|uniref:Alpha-1-antitrypsin n=1 Tax=Thelohanellus kitauei TaxID=669202 RepID=A0A0C2MJU8_THEKT|nr:Alpha-1-antitrypsin [Thelohanellus kitauei]